MATIYKKGNIYYLNYIDPDTGGRVHQPVHTDRDLAKNKNVAK